MAGGIPLAAGGYYPNGFSGVDNKIIYACQRGPQAAIREASKYVRYEFWPAPVFRGDAITPTLAIRPLLHIAARYPSAVTTGDVLQPREVSRG